MWDVGKEARFRALQSVRHGCRFLARGKVFSLTILLSLAIGIGTAGAAFSCFEVLFLRALPGVRGADRVLALFTEMRGVTQLLPVSHPNYRDLREAARSFAQLAAVQPLEVALAGGGAAGAEAGSGERVRAEMVTANYFPALGVEPMRGRFFLEEEDRVPGRDAVAVLSEALWRRRFGGDAGIVGRPLRINGRPFVVVGVAGRGFRGVDTLARPELWVPAAMYREVSPLADLFEQRGDQTLQLFGRLRPGVGAGRAGAELAALSARLASAYPADNRDQRVVALPLSTARLRGKGRAVLTRVSAFLIGMGALLLLVTCGNVASLTVVRTLGRLDELALRSALGAGRGRISWTLLAEGLPLALLALPVGLAVMRTEIWLLWRLRPPFLPADLLLQPLDAPVLALVLGVALAASAFLWLAPALAVRHLTPVRAVRQRADVHLGSDRLFSLRRLVVITEVGLSFVAICCAAYSAVHLRGMQRVDPGFDSRRLLSVGFDLRGLDLQGPRARRTAEQLEEGVAALPGVQAAVYASERLLGGSLLMHSVALPARDAAPTLVGSNLVEPGYFAAVGIPLLRGRAFSLVDVAGKPPVAMVNATMAEQLWPGGSAVRQLVQLDNDRTPIEVVGVVADSMLSGVEEVRHPFLYLPLAQHDSARLALQVRVKGDPRRFVEPLARRMRQGAPSLPVEVEAVSTTLDRTLWWPQAMAGLLSVLSCLTLFVAGTGIYGVAAYVTGLRRSEIGLRLALGAGRQAVLALILREGLQILVAGSTVGALAAVGLARWQVGAAWRSPLMLAILGGSAGALLVVTLIAELGPALRGTRTDPAAVLRG